VWVCICYTLVCLWVCCSCNVSVICTLFARWFLYALILTWLRLSFRFKGLPFRKVVTSHAYRKPRTACRGRGKSSRMWRNHYGGALLHRNGNHSNECDVINIWILQGDKNVGTNITERSKSWYEYYRAIKSWYEYYRVIKNLVLILQGDQKVGINITGWSKSWYEYYRVIKKLVWILQGDQKVGMNITG
jgi:hypothetical protein